MCIRDSLRDVRRDGLGTETIEGGGNYASLPIIPMYANDLHQSEFVGIRESIDCYDFIKSGLANVIEDNSSVYWTLKNAGGMDCLLYTSRVEVSHHKYGPARKNFGEGRVDALETAQLCLDAFHRDHNTEHLVDAANYLMFRWMFPMPGEFFRATGSGESVGTVGTPINMED